MALESTTEAVVGAFKAPDDPEFAKPDRDPHGESCASAAHSSTFCDECGRSGLVATTTLEMASGVVDGQERDVVCPDCASDGD